MVCRLLVSPLASPAGYAGPAGRRPPPLRIVWACLRNVRLLFSVAGAVATAAAEKEAGRIAAERNMEATTKLASAAVDVRPHPLATCIIFRILNPKP